MRMTILYHANCPDGFGAALAFWLHYGKRETQYIPVTYGEPPPEIPTESEVIIVDFSYPKETLLALWERHKRVIVLDHHKSAKTDLQSLCDPLIQEQGLTVFFDLAESGATMAWKYMQDEMEEGPGQRWDELETAMPPFFKFLRDRDLWRWELVDSKEVSLALWSLPRDFATWARWMDNTDGLALDGAVILRYATRLVEEQALRWRPGLLGGHNCLIVNATCLFSEVGDWLCTEFSKHPPEVPFVAYYFDRSDGQRQWGLRGRGKVDLSVLAQEYGGGGHHDAAGFTSDVAFLPVI